MLLISPDGALNLLPFNALVDENTRWLITRYELSYLASGRDLVRAKRVGVLPQSPPVAFVNPDYGPMTGVAPHPGTSSEAQRSAESASGGFAPLPDTGALAEAVKAVFPEMQILCCGEATEGALKKVHGPRFLLLATHGQFLRDFDRKPSQDADSSVAIKENPLLRSSLAFAGANRLKSGAEDGVLTALEAASLDLTGTRLAVLSACETGVGEVQTGEGVYGLRRAFVVAGAESQVMSLWRVPRDATKSLIANYFQGLAHGGGRSQALRQAQCKMLADTNSSHPYFWAAFIPSGQWTDLKGKAPASVEACDVD
jgi:CHAT domain-containing protein